MALTITFRSPISLQRNGVQPTPHLEEMGATGTQIFGGLLTQQDYNAELAAPNIYDVYDKMRLGDGQVKAALTIIKLPLLNTDWYVEPPTDRPQDREIADFIHDGLMEGMTHSFQDHLQQVLLHLDYGVMPFEKVWTVHEGRVYLRKLAPRLPKSVLHWLTDETGGLAGIRQGALTASTFKIVDIPVDKLLVFVHELEGSNWKGVSILRAAYKHHYYKDNLYRLQAIALEKRSLGVDVGTLQGEAITDTRKKDLERALMTLHGHEKQFFTEVEGQTKYRLEGIGRGGVLDPLDAIEHHDLRIVRSMITEFLAMGAGSTGSLAMHKDKSSLFLLSLGGIANRVAETHSKYLIRQWVDYNWSNIKEYPRLRYRRLEARDVAVFAKAVLDLSQAAALTPTPEVEAEARSLLDLPPQPPGSMRDREIDDMDEMPTEEALAAIRSLRRLLKRRREVAAAL